MAKKLQETVGERTREHRMSLELSQEELAERLGVHRTYVGSIERGERNLTLQTVEHLADLLGLGPLDLLR